MEIINKKYLIKTESSRTIILIRGGIQVFVITSAEMKKFQIQNRFSTNFIQRHVISTQNKLGKKVKSDVFKALLILTRQF